MARTYQHFPSLRDQRIVINRVKQVVTSALQGGAQEILFDTRRCVKGKGSVLSMEIRQKNGAVLKKRVALNKGLQPSLVEEFCAMISTPDAYSHVQIYAP